MKKPKFTWRALGLLLFVLAAIQFFLPEDQGQVNTTRQSVTSKDGTTIAYEQAGNGPVLVVVSAALADREGTAKLARLLAAHFTVINYDRRGRGRSTDTQPYSTTKEVQDIEALVAHAGGSAYVFGNSSGAVLALEAATKLGAKVTGLFLYEPPFIIDNSRPPMPADFSDRATKLVTSGDRNAAVKMFFGEGMGIPSFIVTLMRWLMPGWSKMTAVAHTIPYDLAVLAGTQDGKPLPASRWTGCTARTLVMVGSKSEPFFHTGAKSLAKLLPNAQYAVLEGRDHSAVMMRPGDLNTAITNFFH